MLKLEEQLVDENSLEEIYLAGGCLWGVQEFIRHISGVVRTEAGRVNGTSNSTKSEYDGYAECVRVVFDPNKLPVFELFKCFFEIIDPYSINKQGEDVGVKYRTGIHSKSKGHLNHAMDFISNLDVSEPVAVEVLPLVNFVRSDEEHQDRLTKNPNEKCHIPRDLLYKYKT